MVDVIFVSPRTARLLAIPTPPSIAKALPVKSSVPNPTLVVLPMLIVPSEKTLAPIPIPPATLKAPVVALVDASVESILNL